MGTLAKFRGCRQRCCICHVCCQGGKYSAAEGEDENGRAQIGPLAQPVCFIPKRNYTGKGVCGARGRKRGAAMHHIVTLLQVLSEPATALAAGSG